MVSLQVLNALLNICLWFINAIFAKLLEKVYVYSSRLEFRTTGRTFSMDSGEVSIFRGLKALMNMLCCNNINPNARYISSTWVCFLIVLSLISLPSEVWVETGIDERNDCRARTVNTTGVCSSPWAGHSDVGIASAALLVQRSEWIDSDWDIVYEGSSVNLSLSDVHKIDVGRSILPDAEVRMLEANAVARKCNVEVLACTDCGTLTVGKDGGTFATIITNASIVDDPDHCRQTNDNYCRGDLTYDTATGLAFFFWSVRTEESNRERRIATKGIEVLLTDEEIHRVLNTNETVWEIVPGAERSRLYSISCASKGLHWTDLTRAVSIFRTVQMESPGEKKENVNGELANVQSLTRGDVLKSVFAVKAEDIGSNCQGIVPQYTQCGTFDISKASILLAVNSFTVLLYIALRIAVCRQKRASFPISTGSWKRYATGSLERSPDFIIAIETDSPDKRLVAIDVSKQTSDSLS